MAAASNQFQSILIANQDLNDWKIFSDHFEIIDGDEIILANNYDQYHRQLQEDFLQNFNFDHSLSIIEEKQEQEQSLFDACPTLNSRDEETNEHRFFQPLHQLLSHTTDTSWLQQQNKTFMRKKKDIVEEKPLPYYLQRTNPLLFDQMLEQEQFPLTNSSLTRETLRQLAVFMYYIGFYHQLDHLWSIYLQAAQGQLVRKNKSGQFYRPFWSKHVQFVRRHSKIIKIPSDIKNQDESIIYQYVIKQQRQIYQERLHYYQERYKSKTQSLSNHLTCRQTQAIENWVQKYTLTPLIMKCDLATQILYCDCDDYQCQYEYEQENPTEYQQQVGQRLYESQIQLENTKDMYFAQRQRILYNQSPISYDQLQIPLPTYFTSITSNLTLRQQYADYYEQLIQQTKADFMVVRLATLEAHIYQNEQIILQEKKTMFNNHYRKVNGTEMTTRLLHLIEQRTTILREKSLIRRQFLLEFYLRTPYGLHEAMTKEKIKTISRLGFHSNLIIDSQIDEQQQLQQLLTVRQRQLLSRGPTYVAPCQMHLLQPSTETLIQQQSQSLRHQLDIQLNKYLLNSLETTDLQKTIRNRFHTFFSPTIPPTLTGQAIEIQKVIHSIRRTCDEKQLLLRRLSNQSNIFYLTTRSHFEDKCTDYMQQYQTNYELFYTAVHDATNLDRMRHELHRVVRSLNVEFEKLSKNNGTMEQICPKFHVQLENVQLSDLYFLPELTSMKGTIGSEMTVKPVFSTYRSLTWKLAKYLYHLLIAFTMEVMKRTSLLNEGDFIQRLHEYCFTEQQLQSTTLFASIKIMNYQTIYSSAQMLDSLVSFLNEHNNIHKPAHISITMIRKLTDLFFRYNLFYYKKNIYRFRRGAPNSMHFSDLLSDIYVYLWQKQAFDDVRLKTELFVRYKDQIFFTWNYPEQDLHTFFQQLQKQYGKEYQMDLTIGRCVIFFNTHVENRSGQLYTCVHHLTDYTKLVLPYVVGHAKHMHRQWFRSALIRAGQLCSSYRDFHRERIYLEMSCLLAGYAIDTIETELKNFYYYFDLETARYNMNENIYNELRRRLLIFNKTQKQTMAEDLELEINEKLIRLPFLYDYGPQQQWKDSFTEIWSQFVQKYPQLASNKSKILLEAKHLFSLNTLLADQKPSHKELLK